MIANDNSSCQGEFHGTPIVDFLGDFSIEEVVHVQNVDILSPNRVPRNLEISPSSAHFQLYPTNQYGL